MLNNQQIASLTTKKILFGHQSVGNDISTESEIWRMRTRG